MLLMVALYISTPLDFSSLPGVILISTVFRLALTVSTTRLILAEGDAGSIIRTFGDFVISGNIVVGIVIFLVVTMVQFIVVAKGAERVAEVAARFTLDALPGKQMGIDAELRNGHIDQNEARSRRATLEKESQLYGAMDGAMKFVKGDAIAGLVVICVNMLGGITIGPALQGHVFPGGAASIYPADHR
ncbi:type III secretory pathway component EscV [Bradyrhizobium sp. GM22.5]